MKALPSPQHLRWAEAELGVIIHLDLQVFEPSYHDFRACWGYTPSASIFNPDVLDTDQWLSTAKAAGARYAILVAKHCSGFSFWPTAAHDYSVKSSPWRNGTGDVVADFIRSCEKYGILPGLYCSASCNARFQVDNPGRVRSGDPQEQQRYNAIVEQQLTELWSNYGKLFEIWFDGGVIPPEEGGPNLIPLLHKYQPDAIVLDGPTGWPALIRTIGNERGEAPDPCWATSGELRDPGTGGLCPPRPGDPDGEIWAPGESDLPNRDQIRAFMGGWFWRAGDEKHLYSLDHLTERYFTSVGRNTNMLIGMVIDPHGRVPAADVTRFAEFGQRIRAIFQDPVTEDAVPDEALLLSLPDAISSGILAIGEDVRLGERVRDYSIEGLISGEWLPLAMGRNIGHLRLERLSLTGVRQLRLRILQSDGAPRITKLRLFRTDTQPAVVRETVFFRCKITIDRDRQGNVSLRCSNPFLSLYYTIDGREPDRHASRYTAPFPLPDGATVKAVACVNPLEMSQVSTAVFGCLRHNWKVIKVSFNSPYANNGAAGVEHLLDDDSQTYWHTYHRDKSLSAMPQEVLLDAGKSVRIRAFTLLPHHTDGVPEAFPDRSAIQVSDDLLNWRDAARAEFDDAGTNPLIRVVELPQTITARYIRLTVSHVQNDRDYLILAGLGAVLSCD